MLQVVKDTIMASNLNNNRKSIELLPAFFRTEKNSKFLSSTIDQLIKKPALERIDGYIGDKLGVTYNPSTDFYLPESSSLRLQYQLEPALVIKTLDQSIKSAYGIDDLINQISFHDGYVDNLDRLFKPKFNSFDPHIDWDKFVNFREYYWLSNGPDTIYVAGPQRPIVNTYNVTDSLDGKSFIFTPDGLTEDPSLIFYRGVTYTFNISCSYPLYFKETYVTGTGSQFNTNVSANGVTAGQIVITVDDTTPDILYYISSNIASTGDRILVKDLVDNAVLNVDVDIVGKASYTTTDEIEFINGLKIRFIGEVIPASYSDREFIVEGVGDSITLVDFESLSTPGSLATLVGSVRTPITPEYVTINRSSKDLNPWSRYNRWVHSDVIRTAAAANGVDAVYPFLLRASRPIVEFHSNIQLWNFGINGLPNVDLIDEITTDVFSIVENSPGYYVDGTLLEDGHRVMFLADPDPLVQGIIYDVTVVDIDGNSRINLTPAHSPIINDSVIINLGETRIGSSWHFNGDIWVLSQQRTTLNQSPAFDLYDDNGHSYSDQTYYNSTFAGTYIFGYARGTGVVDPVLGFPLSYHSQGVAGSYVFKNYFNTDTLSIIEQQTTLEIQVSKGYLRTNLDIPEYATVWTEAASYSIPVSDGNYDIPINLTNNPLNGPIGELTFSEISAHVETMTESDPEFVGVFPGVSNLKSLPSISKYGNRLISNLNPLSFSHYFITDVEHSLINATRRAANEYYQFKLNLIKFITEVSGNLSASDTLDAALLSMNSNKTQSFPYALSDMIAYGDNYTLGTYTVTNFPNTRFALSHPFDLSTLSTQSVLIYVNDTLLIHGNDYTFDIENSGVDITYDLIVGDVIRIKEYVSTIGSYIVPTPTKLGLYPKYEPSIYVDSSYASGPVKVIQGHDGSISIAFSAAGDADDFRDLALLEFEKRIFNNIKVVYDQSLFDVTRVTPGVFRSWDYSYSESNNIARGDFLKWASVYGVDFSTNSTYDADNHKTYNFKSATDTIFLKPLPGSWRGIYKFYFDTDRPNTHPWEMLGFSIMPDWWESEYGMSPYTSGNLNLWQDLENGYIRYGTRMGIDPVYARPGLSTIIPVDDSGNLIDVSDWAGIASNDSIPNPDQNWEYGDNGPAESSWKKTSLWPFMVQLISAITQPADYAAMMFDTSRMKPQLTGQYYYGTDKLLLDPRTVVLPSDKDESGNLLLTSGYSVWVVEEGMRRSSDYLSIIKQDLASADFNLFYKVGGFVSKDNLSVIIDSVSPSTPNPGVFLPEDDFSLHFNVSNPVKTVAASGVIVEKTNGQYMIKGYDPQYPYFTIYSPVHKASGSAVTVGGKSETYLIWRENAFYQAGQIVSYNNSYYRVIVSHNTGSSFIAINYSPLASLPMVGGASVLASLEFSSEETIIPYGTRYSTLQEVYDIIIGYGRWLEVQGFIFDEYNQDLYQVLDWRYTGKEFLYWTTQNWADGTVIAMSPFSNQLKYKFSESVVDNVLNSFYEYSLLKSDGRPFPVNDFSLSREDGVCIINTSGSPNGLFFARLNLVQKEHVIIFNNVSMFNDVIYDIETGYRQNRVKLSGFKTAEWNGEFISPGFMYDDANINEWFPYTDYKVADLVKYLGNYYSANNNLIGTQTFNFNDWRVLGNKPLAQLLPNFDYKISQFEDFYSLDIDNFDESQKKMAQHLIGYVPRTYLDNIFVNPIAQYKFYQGFIRERGTKNAIDKLAKASVHNLHGKIEYTEEWAFRIGYYGGYPTYSELELPLREYDFRENSQIVKFVDDAPSLPEDVISYIVPGNMSITPDEYVPSSSFITSTSTFRDNNLLLPTAGYVRIDDITATAYNKNSLLDIANNGNIKEGDTIWLGFRDDGDWDVYRYTKQQAKISNAVILVPGQSLTFISDIFHKVLIGDLVSIHGLDNGTDGVYSVIDVPSLTSFTVDTTLTSITDSKVFALLYKFVSVRIGSYDKLSNLTDVVHFRPGDLFWSDTKSDGRWAVYKRSVGYNSSVFDSGINQPNQEFGFRIATTDNSNIVVISAPSYKDEIDGYGRIYFYLYSKHVLTLVAEYGINATPDQNCLNSTPTNFGSSLLYDIETDIIFAGAPLVDIVKLSRIDRSLGEENTLAVLTVPGVRYGVAIFETDRYSYGDHSLFGTSLFVSKTVSSNIGFKTLIIGAPGAATSSTNVGAVSIYAVDASTGTSTVNVIPIGRSIYSPNNNENDQFGFSVTGNTNGETLVVGAPGAGGTGTVYLYSYDVGTSEYVRTQTIYAPPVDTRNGDKFGNTITMSGDGEYLFISAPLVTSGIIPPGRVYVYKLNGVSYELVQTITSPSTNGIFFGDAISIDTSSVNLVISSRGNDVYTDSLFDNGDTTFDGGTCKIGSLTKGSGSAFVFTRYADKFIFDEQLVNNTVADYSRFGESVAINSDTIFVGSPGNLTYGNRNGNVYLFFKDSATNGSAASSLVGWELYREEEDLVDVAKIGRVVTIDSMQGKILDYLDIIDPLKGKISGLADQEVRYKTAFDPAIYSIGTTNVVVDTNTSWIDEHIGELWWDLSTVKYIWYEQGDLEYRKNSWGNLFPGSSIDIYEWVKSAYLPTQWSVLADTPEGLANGISGQPKYVDNSVISVKQYYNASTGSTTNVYYFWVKNTVILPNSSERRIPASEVANLIYNPSTFGMKYVSILSADALAVTNVRDSLISDKIYLNISQNNIDVPVNKHTEWLLIAEGDASSMPNAFLDKKLIDSLLGKDSVGNPVPEPTLTDRVKYGLSIRPRQSMFKDRVAALRNSIDYTNTILKLYLISDIISFNNLNSKEEIPDIEDRSYDLLVADLDALNTVVTTNLITAELTCDVIDGKIVSITITNPGYGYVVPPTVAVLLDSSGAFIKTSINDSGQVVSTSIIDSGSGFITSPILEVRPFTVIVQVDSDSLNRWSEYQWTSDKWFKIHTQQFDTTQYWDYVDWVEATYDPLKPLFASIEQPYLLDTLETVSTGDYVKIENQGNGRYIILEKVASGGTFDDSYDLIYSENGTIQLRSTLWDTYNSFYNFDYKSTFDQTLYDQSAEMELEKILFAIKNDIFVGELKVYWNKFFFKAVKYALSEQLFLDWAFKSSFINVKNLAGTLDQRPVYKFQNSQYYEEYIEEVKPYHTKIRKFQVNYDLLDPSQTYTTDFDLPAVYDIDSNEFTPVDIGDPLLAEYPRKAWNDNYKFGIGGIQIISGGSGYLLPPTVTIVQAAGDTVTTATAIATIALGSVDSITMTSYGDGYTQTPTVILSGSGSTSTVDALTYAQLSNSKVRSNSIGLKFDRISPFNEITNSRVTDVFTASGITSEFVLSWAAENKKANIEVLLDGIYVLATDYEIISYTEIFNDYHKSYSKLVFSSMPLFKQVVQASYNKNIELYHAVERITNFYSPTSGMPGVDPAQLMTGIDYPGTQFANIPFASTLSSYTYWDEQPFGDTPWDSDESGTRTLETTIDGGDLSYLLATGIDPTDIILDGENFISPNISHAPEEMLPGIVRESVGIGVYTSGTSTLLGYRIFKDILHRTLYTRISTTGTTVLTVPLNFNDTTITVANSAALQAPSTGTNVPGIVLIDGEYISYMEMSGNVLSRITRSILGSGAKTQYPVNSQVINQSSMQAVQAASTGTSTSASLFSDFENRQVITASTSTTSYIINTSTIVFTVSTSSVHPNQVALQDQVAVYYGGFRLQKSSRDYHDFAVSYDNNEVFEDVLPAEFTITSSGTHKILTLNLNTEIKDGVRITLVQNTGTDWYNSTSTTLETDTSTQAVFLQTGPASLPDKYYYV